MITELAVSNYRSIGERIVLKPEGITVLIGSNGSGKSNILDVLSFLRETMLNGLHAAITHRGGIDNVRRRSSGHPFNVTIEAKVKLRNGVGEYGFEITGDRLEEYRIKSEHAHLFTNEATIIFKREGEKITHAPEGVSPRTDLQSLALTALGGDTRFKPLYDIISNLTVYSISPDVLRSPQKFDSERPMKRSGENWVSVLRDMCKAEFSAEKQDILDGLYRLTGDIEDFKVSSAASYLVAEFRQKKEGKQKRWFEAALQSDGTLRFAGLITALLSKPALPVIGIEEPELTVHPGVLPMLYDYIKQASKNSQILLTTHSPIMLDVIDIERDSLYIVERKDGVTAIKRADPDKLEPVRKGLLSLGELYVSNDLQLELFSE